MEMRRFRVLLLLIGLVFIYALVPPDWEFTADIPVATRAYDIVETPTGALLAAIAEWTAGSDAIIYRSTDGGNSWVGVCYPVLYGGSCWDIEISGTTGRIYAAMNLSNGVEQRIYYSTDDGVTWTQLSTRIPLSEIFYGSNSLNYHPVGLKCYNGKLYVFGRSKQADQGPLFHGEVWYYDEATGIWGKWNIVNLNADDGGWTIETGPGPAAGIYLYLGTYNTGRVIRSNNPISLKGKKGKIIRTNWRAGK